MTDIVLDDVASGFNLSGINNNFEVVKDVINDDLVHLWGGNNVMRQNLDMNSRRLLNLPQPSSGSEPARLADLQAVISGGIDDAALINYTAAGTGAVELTLKGYLDSLYINAQTFGAIGDGVADDTEAVQAAVDECLLYDPPRPLLIPKKCRLTASINIDRQVDGATNDNYFIIRGGGFVVDSAIPMFSSSIAFTTAPVSQLVMFDGVTFSSTDSSLAAYVLHGARFLRTSFVNCSFQKIKCLTETASHTQSIYFINCNARRWQGKFFYCNVYNYDLKVIGGLWEAGVDAFKIKNPVGCSFAEPTIEGMSGTAISYDGAEGLNITMYGEQNGLDIDGTYGATSVSVAYGVVVSGSYFAKTPTTISGATQANPVVVTTSAAHGYANGTRVYIVSVGGMTELNGNSYVVANAASTTFELQGVNGTGYGAFVADGNGRCHPYTIKWGQTNKCLSFGNRHTGAMHDVTSSTDDLIVYDIAQEKLSNDDQIQAIQKGYDGTFVGTLTGCTTSPTATFRYNKTGNTVTIYVPAFTGVSNTTACTITGLPSHLYPTRQQICLVRLTDNSANLFGICIVDTGGDLVLGTGADGNVFTAANNKGPATCAITYSLT